jgi:hypothetical protein
MKNYPKILLSIDKKFEKALTKVQSRSSFFIGSNCFIPMQTRLESLLIGKAYLPLFKSSKRWFGPLCGDRFSPLAAKIVLW